MLQIISSNDSKIILNPQSPQKNIDMINEHIKLCSCKNMTVDMTSLNIFDACMVSTLCSAEHFMKYPDGKINWIVNSQSVKDYSKSMTIGNSNFIIK